MKTFTSLFIIISAVINLLIPRAYSQRLEAQTDSLVKSRLPGIAPGAVILIAKNGKMIYRKAFGIADLKTKATMTPEMIFRIGSITKQFTAVAVLQLIEQGKVKLQDSIQVYIPNFPHKAYPISIENLLTQTSGIINFQEITEPDPQKVHEHYTPAQGVDYFKDEPLRFKPGSRFEYSNSNYFLLGYIVGQISGQSFGSYLQDHIIGPANLKHTFYLPTHPETEAMASGYSRFDGKHWENAELQDPSTMYVAGALTSNADDLLQWHQALSEGKLVSKAMLTRAYTAFKPTGALAQYGYGWFIKDIDSIKTVEHSGSTDGYQTDEIWLPQYDVLVITLFNGFENDMDWQLITNDIARFAIGHPLKTGLQLNDDSLKALCGTYAVGTEHQMVISLKKHQLYIEATNPKDRLPQVKLFAESPSRFYIKEAALKFEFKIDAGTGNYVLTTYNTAGKDAEWKKVK